jgi:hypothetical protein
MIIANRYRVLESLATGSFGEVFFGVELESKRKVAIKLESISAQLRILYHEAIVYKRLIGGCMNMLISF